MRPRSTTLVSAPAPPASGSIPPPSPASDDLDGEVVLELSRRTRRAEPSAPPISQSIPISGRRPRAASADIHVHAAKIAAASLAAGFDASAVLIHAHDSASGMLRVVGVWGAGTDALLGEVEPSDDDFVASTVMTNGHPMTMLLGGGLPRIAPRRLAVLRAAKSLVAVPVLRDGACVGLIEVVDVAPSLTARVARAAGVVAESLASSL